MARCGEMLAHTCKMMLCIGNSSGFVKLDDGVNKVENPDACPFTSPLVVNGHDFKLLCGHTVTVTLVQ